MHRPQQVSAALLLVLLAAASVLPLARADAARHGCHCVVRMACCEDGTCTMGDAPPATGAEWRTCRREAPATTTSIDAFEQALTKTSPEMPRPGPHPPAPVLADSVRARVPSPATPPPR